MQDRSSEGSAAGRLVERFYHEVWNLADEAVAREILSPGFRFRGSLGPQMQGVEAFVGYMRSIHAALADYVCTIEAMIVEGDRVAARMTFRGRSQGVLFGVAPTGREVSWAGAAFFTMRAGRIDGLWVLGDVDGLKAQLNLGPSGNFTSGLSADPPTP
jgi:predicted ester cyclase